MSVLIKGMQMPQGNSTINVLIYADGTVYTGHVNDSQYSAVSVPTSHGRLIDADAFRKRCLEAIPYGFADEDEIKAYNKILGLLKEAPTIIEAEE